VYQGGRRRILEARFADYLPHGSEVPPGPIPLPLKVPVYALELFSACWAGEFTGATFEFTEHHLRQHACAIRALMVTVD